MTKPEIDAFLSVCRYKNISRAAEALHISQSSLSTRLKMLEDHLACSLLLRSKGRREVSLTVQGQSFYDLALQYQDILEKMESVGRGVMTDKLHVSAINSVGNYLLPPVFRHFAGKYPNIRLVVQDMEAEMACASIIRGRTDIAFSTAKVETDQIIATSFLTEPMTILHASGLSLPDEVSLEQLPLADEIHIRWSAEHAYWYHAAFPDPCPRIELELMGQIALFVSRYQGWTIVPKSVADSLCDHSDLQQSKPVFHMPVRTIYILRHRDYAETAIIHCFLDVLREVLQEPYGDNFLL